MDERRMKVLLSPQTALLGAVTPNLRAVGVQWDDTHIHFTCYFDGAIGDEDRETMDIVDTEVLSDFPESHEVTYDVVRLDFTAQIPRDETLAYYRKEDWSSVTGGE